MGLGAAGSLYLYFRGKPVAAGAVLSLCLFKWHLLLLVPVAMVLGRHWRMLAGFSAGALCLLGIDLALDGIAGWQAYLKLLSRTDLDRMTPGLEMMPTAQGMLANFNLAPYSWMGALVALGLFGYCAWRLEWPQAMLAALTAGILWWPHAFIYDLSTLLFPLVALVDQQKSGLSRWMGFLLLAPLIFFVNVFGAPWSASIAAVLFALLVSLVLVARQREMARNQRPELQPRTVDSEPC